MTTELLKSLQQITGNAYSFAFDDDKAAPYRKQFGFIAGREVNIAAVTLPDSVESLQATIKLTVDQGLSIWGMPNAAANGATVGDSNRPGLIIDQRRMDRILEVNAEAAYALIEPGVSYRQLHEHLRNNKIPLWVDCDSNPDNSISGSITSRQFGYTPYGDHLLMQCGMEVVLADGELLRTGMGALPKSDTWQLFKYNFGPYIDGLFTQSNLALVSKIGLWLMPEPPVYKPFMISLPDREGLAAMIEILRPMKINQVIPNTVAITADQNNPKQWRVYGALYGAPDNVEITWTMLSDAFTSINGAGIYLESEQQENVGWRERMALMRGNPIPTTYPIDVRGDSAYMQLTAAAPIEGKFALDMLDIVTRTVTDHGMDYRYEYALTSRTMLKYIYLPYVRSDSGSRDKAANAARALLEALASAGFGITGESVELRHVADQFFGNSGLADLTGRLRQGLIPQTAG